MYDDHIPSINLQDMTPWLQLRFYQGFHNNEKLKLWEEYTLVPLLIQIRFIWRRMSDMSTPDTAARFRCVLCPDIAETIVPPPGPRRHHSVEPTKSYIMTTRFNTDTWNQHRRFMDAGSAGAGISACYCSPMSISSQILSVTANTSVKLLVLEMHNDQNKIMGIGAVFSRSHYRRYTMYSDDKYNVCAFVGPYRIDRADMTADEEVLMLALDAWCFRGKRHMKRLRGLTLFSPDLMAHARESHDIDIRSSIQCMFRRRFTTS
jgi:hypothetical protein